jgi:hypothetical protein
VCFLGTIIFFRNCLIELQRKGYKISMLDKGMSNRTMPVCLTAEQYEKISSIAKAKGMLSADQAIEKILEEI